MNYVNRIVSVEHYFLFNYNDPLDPETESIIRETAAEDYMADFELHVLDERIPFNEELLKTYGGKFSFGVIIDEYNKDSTELLDVLYPGCTCVMWVRDTPNGVLDITDQLGEDAYGLIAVNENTQFANNDN